MTEVHHLEKARAARLFGATRNINSGEQRLSQGSSAVLRTAASITPDLLKEHPEIVELYRETTLTGLEIAREVVPDVASAFPRAVRAAVGNVLRELIPAEERARITANRRKVTLRRITEKGLGEVGFKEHQSAAVKARWKRGNVDTEAMVRGKGLTPWTMHERQFALYLRSQVEYQYQGGSHNGLPISSNIAKALNEAFHGGKVIRDGNGVRSILHQYK